MKKSICCLFVFLFSTICFSQTNFKNGYIVNNNNDTIQLKIKNDDNAILSRSIITLNDSIEQTYNPKQIASYSIGTRIFDVLLVNIANIDAIKMVFAERLINGPIRLYNYYYTDYNGTSTYTNSTKYIKRNKLDALEINKNSFNKKVPYYLYDYPVLSELVKNKKYSSEQINEVVIKYNNHSNNNVIVEDEFKEIESSPTPITYTPKRFPSNRPTFGWENTISLVYSSASPSETMMQADNFDFNGGWTYELGTGIILTTPSDLAIRFGIKNFKKYYEFSFSSTFYDNQNNFIDISATEKSTFNYFGGYIRVLGKAGDGYIGGGFDFSFTKAVSTDVSYVLNGVSGLEKGWQSTSLQEDLDAELKNQFDLIFTLGKDFEMNNTKIKPNIEFSIPMNPILEVPNVFGAVGDIDVGAVLIKLGVILEFNL